MGGAARYFAGVCYPENMVEGWQNDIGGLLQLPFVYCIHDKDQRQEEIDNVVKHEERKTHVHIIIVFGNTTTLNRARQVFNSLSAPGRRCCSTCQPVISMRYMYDYLIHDTEDAKKKGKYQYKESERVCGNNFDIGLYEVLDEYAKLNLNKALCAVIQKHCFFSYFKFVNFVYENFDDLQIHSYIEKKQSFFSAYIRGYKAEHMDNPAPTAKQLEEVQELLKEIRTILKCKV